MKRILLLIISITLIFSLASCDKEYTVTFTVDGVTVNTTTVKRGEAVSQPKDPVKDGYTFFGWTLEGADFDFSTPVKKDLTLEAKIIDNATVAWGDGLAYTISEDGSYYSVSGIGGYKTADIVIPDTYLGLPVTEILPRAFFGNTALSSVSIPASITAIGDRAFSDCTALTSFSVAEENTAYSSKNGNLWSKDGTVLVQYCIGRADTAFTVDEGAVKIGAGAFSRSSITSLSFPSTLQELGAYSCYASNALTSVAFPNGSSLTLIGEGAFSSCISITEFNVPKSVEKIEKFAFYSCKKLNKVVFEGGSSLSEVGEYVFELCELLSELHYDGSREKWDFIVNTAANNDHLNKLKFVGIASFSVPDGAWVPTEEYEGITYAAWAQEADYLAGLAPVKWYTDYEITREKFGATDDDGTTYPEGDFIPGYIHLFADINATATQQLIVGDAQKLVLNLGGYTLTSKKGFRIGGNYAYHPEASLVIKCGTFNLIQGQIQPRYGSTLIFEDTIFITTATDVMYGVQSKLLSFVRSEVIVGNGADFRLATNFKTEPIEMFISFVDSDVIYTSRSSTAIFEMYESTIGDCKWNISFDKDSAVFGKVTNYVMICESLTSIDENTKAVIPFPETQQFSYSAETRFLFGASVPTGYAVYPVDLETGALMAPVNREGSDEFVNITVTD